MDVFDSDIFILPFLDGDISRDNFYGNHVIEPHHDKTNKVTVCPAKTQISLGIRPVWSESSLCAQWVAKDPRFLHADSVDFDQTGRMHRLIWVFAGRTCHFVGFVMRRLILLLIWLAWVASHVYNFNNRNDPAHEIIALFILRKLILQTRMRSHPVGLDVCFLVGPFVYFHISCVRTVKALVRLRGMPEPSLVAYVISTIISWAGSNKVLTA